MLTLFQVLNDNAYIDMQYILYWRASILSHTFHNRPKSLDAKEDISVVNNLLCE